MGLTAQPSFWLTRNIGRFRTVPPVPAVAYPACLAQESEQAPSKDDVPEVLKELTGGRGPDACIEAVGGEAHGTGPGYAYDKVKQALRLETDRGRLCAKRSWRAAKVGYSRSWGCTG